MYKPYPKMKDSGVPWIGEIPEHWEVNAVKYSFDICLGKMLQPSPLKDEDIEVPYLKAQHVMWEILRYDVLPRMWATMSEIQKYKVKEGDLLVCEGGEVGRACVVTDIPSNTIIQNALHRVRPCNGSNLSYLMYMLEHASNMNWFEIVCNRATIAHFTSEKFKAVLIPNPYAEEQQSIAAFLDRETSRIDALIDKKERLIALLREKRQALITRAVTKGLDPNAKMKDSGVPWIGEIPAGWEVRKVKHVVYKIGSGKTPKGGSQVYVNKGIMLIRSQNVHFDGLRLEDVVFINNQTNQEMSNTIVNDYDILLNITGASIGRCCVVPQNIGPANVNQHVCIIRPDQRVILSEYLHMIISSNFVQNQINAYQVGTSREGLNFDEIGNMLIALPKDINDQKVAVLHISSVQNNIGKLLEKVDTQITKLRELRQTLISHAVTGKIDVRGEVAVSEEAPA